jgi:hypothetical protein
MSKKHEKRTRAEILARRDVAMLTLHYGPEVLSASRSNYMPHFGAKQRAKLTRSVFAEAA